MTTREPSTLEAPRKLVHIASLAFALLLRWLSPLQAIGLGVGAVVFNILVLPHVGRALFRRAERPGSLTDGGGIIIYPVVVLLLVSLIGAGLGRLDIAAGAWAAMALGDGVATLAGRGLRGPRVPWSDPRAPKTWAGFLGFVMAAGVGVTFFTGWVGARAGGWNAWVAHPIPLIATAIVASVTAALIETLPLPVDDNWTVPLVAAAVLLLGASIDPRQAWEVWQANGAGVAWRGCAVATGLGLLAFAVRSVNLGGLIGGVLLGAATWCASGGWAFAVLAAFFVLASGVTKLGRQRKAARGVAQADGGRRGARHAWANGGIALVCAVAAAGSSEPYALWWRVACVAAYATAAADTVATEIGQWLGGPTLSMRTLRAVTPGTPGAIGLAGTLAGALGAVLVALAAVAVHAVPAAAIVPVAFAAVAASLFESVLGARVAEEWRTPLVHDALNVTNTMAGAVGGLTLARLWWPQV